MTQQQLTTTRKRRPLVEIVADLLEHIEDADGEVTDAIDYLELELEDKVSAYAAVMREFDARDKANTELATEYLARRDAARNARERLKERLAAALNAVGVDKLKTPTTTAYFQKSTAVRIPDEDAFAFNAPDRFVVTTHRPNKKAIRDALDAGEVVEGAELITTRSLRLR